MSIKNSKKIYIIGIEGAGTSALACMLTDMGKIVLGSDEGDHFYYDILQKKNIKVFHQFNADNLEKDLDLIIYSTAHKVGGNKELAFAQDNKYKMLSYAEALAEIFQEKYGIAVCGSHGKTTTSAWLSFVLIKSGLDINAIIGSKVPQLGGGAIVGKSNYLIIEADEYQNKLKHYQAKAVVLNNIDYDHPDFFPNREDYNNVFIDFIKKIPKKGFLVTNFDDEFIARVALVNCIGKVIFYSLKNKEANFFAKNIKVADGKQFFQVLMDGEDLGEFSINLIGQHNIYNALAVIASSIELDITLLDIRKYLGEFRGTARRMQKMGEYNQAIIMDDYAHHPTEIKTTLEGLKEVYPKKNIICVFHPHTFTRTKSLLDDFAKSFQSVNELIVLDIFGSAREKQGGVHSLDLIDKIKKVNLELNKEQIVKHIPSLIEVEDYLRKKISKNDLVILMGAGDVFRIGENLIEKF